MIAGHSSPRHDESRGSTQQSTARHPPRRLVLLHLDGSAVDLPKHGDAVTLEGKEIGFVGSVARHYELGPIALAVIKRTTPSEATLMAGNIAASQEILVPID